MATTTNLIGEIVLLVEQQEGSEPTEYECEIVAVDLGTHTFMIAMKEGPDKGHLYGFSNWTNLRLKRFYRES